MESDDRLDLVVERTIETYRQTPEDQRFDCEPGDLFVNFLEDAISSIINEDLWEQAGNETLTERILTGLADGMPDINCEAIARVLQYRLRNHIAFPIHKVPTGSSTELEPVAV